MPNPLVAVVFALLFVLFWIFRVALRGHQMHDTPESTDLRTSPYSEYIH